MPIETARLFVALWPEPDVREALREWRDSWTWPKSASPVRTGQLHATLHFIGNVERARLPELVRGLEVPFSPFELAFVRPELWHGGIAVLAPDVVPQALLELHGALGEALQGLGLPPEARAYRPHVTLARRASAATMPTQGPSICWRVDRYALMESKPGAGAEYAIVQSYGAQMDPSRIGL